MQTHTLRARIFAFVTGVMMLSLSGWAIADPPSRVGRLNYMSGAVSFSPAGENDWVQAAINRPLTSGDRLWTDRRGRAELQTGGALIRINADTGISILNLDDRIAQLQLTQGTLNIRVRRLDPNQVFEIDTPNLAFTLQKPGEYRIEVNPDDDATTIIVRKGQGEVYGEGAAYVIDSRQAYRFMGTGLREYEYVAAPRLDEFDRWASARDRALDNSRSARYVSQDAIGYQDLDANGTWRVDASYGNVWFPNRMAAGWAPYSDGRWVWVDPWGWTWLDDEPWGFVVSHYGRWTNLRGTWGWVPGPLRTRAWYAPALVAFVGGDKVGGVAWFPLGPREVYRPSYQVSRGYFENVNRSNTVVSATVINNFYNNTNVTNVTYVNRQVPGAVVAVPRNTFVQSQPVSKAVVKMSPQVVISAPVTFAPSVVPTEKSVRGAAAQSNKPPGRAFERPVIARTAPPAAHVGFAAQQQQLTAKQGKPLDDAVRKGLKSSAAAPAPVVKVIAQTPEAAPTRRPPPVAPAGKAAVRKLPSTPVISGAPPLGAAPSQATPPVPAAQAPMRRGKAELPGKGSQSGQAVVAPPQPERAAPVIPHQVAPTVPAIEPSEQRGKAEQRGKRPAVTPPPQPERVAPVIPSQIAPPAPAAQPVEQRAKPEQRGRSEQQARPVAPQLLQSAQPKAASPMQVDPAGQQPARRARPEPAPAVKQPEPPPVASPKAEAPEAEQRGEEPESAAGKPKQKKKDGDEKKNEGEKRKQKD